MAKRAPNIADLLAPVPRGRVRVFFRSSIAADGEGNLVRVEHDGMPGNCYDCPPAFAKGYIDSGQATRLDPDREIIGLLKAAGGSGIRVKAKHSASFLKAAKKAGLEEIAEAPPSGG